MKTYRTQRITEIFKAVLAVPPEERATHLERACAGSPELRQEVEDLLVASERARGPLLGDAPGQDIETPTAIGKYEVAERIGSGGFGEVFLGHDPVIKRPVAIKLCSSAEGALRQRFFREAEIAGRLKHANITTIHDSGSYGETPFMVQEYLRGEDLSLHIRRRVATPHAKRLDYLIQIARGLEYAHRQGVIHRDIKPSNIRVLKDSTVKIMDFGVARLLSARTRLTLTGMRIGTVCYMAPEQLRGEPVDARADVFSFGVLAYELLTYVHPFQAESGHAMMYQILEEEPAALREVWPGCPKRLAACVERCLEKEAEDRFKNMTEVLERLERIDLPHLEARIDTEVTQIRPGDRPARRKSRRQRRVWARWTAAAMFLAIFAAVSLYLVLRPDEPIVDPAPFGGAPAETSPLDPPTARVAPPPTDLEASASPPPSETSAIPENEARDEGRGEAAAREEETGAGRPALGEAVSAPPSPAARTPPSELSAPPPIEAPSRDSEPASGASREERALGAEAGAPRGRVETPPDATSPGTVPIETVPPGTVPIEMVPPSTVPIEMVPIETVPPGTVPPETVPIEEAPEDIVEALPELLPPPAEEIAPGLLMINALPWASIDRIVDIRSGESIQAPSRYTPLMLPMPPGRYSVRLSRPGASEQVCELELSSKATGQCLRDFGRAKAAEFFARYESRRPPPDRPPRNSQGRRGPPPRGDPPFARGGPPPRPEFGRPPSRSKDLPGWILKTANAYFSGDYARGLEILSKKSSSDERTVFYARLFRGASFHAVYLLDGERDTSLLSAASGDVRACRQQNPAFAPHPDFFSPRFIEFFSITAVPPSARKR